jgi:hypothetical protein
MTNLNEIILRIKADTSNFDNPKDIIRDELPQFWRGNNLKFEIGVFDGDNLLSVSSYASITVAIRKMLDNGEIPSASHQALMQKSTYDLNDALTIETWRNGSSQHASIQFSAEESNILSGNHWLSIWASTSDAAPKYITLCAGIIRVCEDGGGISSQPPEPLVVYYTARECDDTFVNKDNVDTNITLGTSDEKISTQKAVKTYVDSIASEKASTASNLGSGEGVFSSKSGANLQFKSLKAGSNVTISSDSSEITISSTGGGGGGMSNPMTTSGDLIVGGTSGTPTRLGVGSAEQALVVNTNCDGVTWKDVLSCTSKSLSSNGYFTFSDGLILQWGYLAFAGTNRKESTITLPVSFSSKNYSFSGLIKSNVSGTDKHSLCLSENARSSSTLTVCIYGADSSTTFNVITWIAVGY